MMHGQKNIKLYQMMYWYNWFSWWWALGCSKHVEKWNKYIKKCVKLVINNKCIDKFSRYVTCPNHSFCLTSKNSQNLMCNTLTKLYHPRLRVNEHFSKCRGRSSGWSSLWRVTDIIRCAVRTTRGPTTRAATSCLNRQKPESFAPQRHTVIARLKSWSSRSFRHTQVSSYGKNTRKFFGRLLIFPVLRFTIRNIVTASTTMTRLHYIRRDY